MNNFTIHQIDLHVCTLLMAERNENATQSHKKDKSSRSANSITQSTAKQRLVIIRHFIRSGFQLSLALNSVAGIVALYRSNYFPLIHKSSEHKISNSLENQHLPFSNEYLNNYPITSRIRKLLYIQVLFEMYDMFDESYFRHKFDISRMMHHILALTGSLLVNNPFYSFDLGIIGGFFLSLNQFTSLQWNSILITKRYYDITYDKLILRGQLYCMLATQLLMRIPLECYAVRLVFKHALYGGNINKSNISQHKTWYYYHFRCISMLLASLGCVMCAVETNWIQGTLSQLGFFKNQQKKQKKCAVVLSVVSVVGALVLFRNVLR